MNTQPEALLKLADAYADASFEQGLNQRTVDPAPELAREALAAELRRLHALTQELLESLLECEPNPENFDFGPAYGGALSRRDAAIAKAEAA